MLIPLVCFSFKSEHSPATFSERGRGFSSSTQELGGRQITLLTTGNEKHLAVRKCSVDYLNCLDLSSFLEVKSNMTGRSYSSINIKSHEIHCKIKNYIYLE